MGRRSPPDGALQGTVLIYTTLIEGLHRRLPYRNTRFPELSGMAVRRLASAARQGARAQAASESADEQEVSRAVAFFDERGYYERAVEVVDHVSSAVPEVADGINDYPRRLTKARNSMAHHLLPAESEGSLSARVLEWIIIETSTRWLLRCLLLLHAGVDSSVLRERMLNFQRFQFYRANLAKHIEELTAATAIEPPT